MDINRDIKANKKNYTILLIADFISSFGSSMTGVALTIYIFSLTNDLFISALFPLASLLPKIIITPFISKINIKCSYRLLFVLGEIAAGITILPFMWLENPYIMLLIYSIYATIFFILELYRAEYLRLISTDKMIVSRKSISQIVNTFVEVVAPIIAGCVLQLLNVNLIYIIDIITYIIAAVLILFIDNKKIINFENAKETSEEKPKEKLNIKNVINKLKLTNNSDIFIGSVVVTFIGGATSLLTLSYVLNYLQVKEIVYTLLMALLSLGAMAGSALVNLKFFQKNSKMVSSICLFLDGVLLLSVLFKPNAQVLGGILFISGILSSLVMTYYAIQIYMSYPPQKIKTKYAIFEICINSSTALSKPFAGLVEKAFGNILSISLMGIVFILTSPINYYKKFIKKREN